VELMALSALVGSMPCGRTETGRAACARPTPRAPFARAACSARSPALDAVTVITWLEASPERPRRGKIAGSGGSP
jgi:hypothetical protein